ncbi:phosphotransferase [Shimia thalassica]|uniref:phosphotransferase n=1 Tax=Shimia thalassica TaxID=1715693 RepID=UPI002735F7D1|nr:phosphotransferase [Shimia thalassica]MDP2520895.1 phosphotransferase [Shimia thalassica]
MTLLIMSSAYVSNEMRNEFGLVPPSFLPAGSGCLYELQFSACSLGGPCHITLPLGFDVPEIDAMRFKALGVTPLFLPENASVTATLISAIEAIRPEGTLKVLFGDTLVDMDEVQHELPDSIAIKMAQSNHHWLYVDPEAMIFSEHSTASSSNNFVSCGYYSFSDPASLVEIAREASLEEVLGIYNEQHSLTCFEPETWLDFGHVSLFYQSKKDLLVSRAFNSVTVQDNVLSKFSSDTRKIRAEANWFNSLPGELVLHCPRFMGETSKSGLAGYSLEYMYLPTLSDLFTLGRLPSRNWSRIFDGVADFLNLCQRHRPLATMPEGQETFADTFFDELIRTKSNERLNYFLTNSKIDTKRRFSVNSVEFPALSTVLQHSLEVIPRTKIEDISLWHGDLFFGNILYDIRAERIMCLDPRGLIGSDFSIYGDVRYDLAKLAHSIFGKYDSIIANRYSLISLSEAQLEFQVGEISHQDKIQEVFEAKILNEFGMSKREALALCSILFLSMLPLHGDDQTRQYALLATALQCYEKWTSL